LSLDEEDREGAAGENDSFDPKGERAGRAKSSWSDLKGWCVGLGGSKVMVGRWPESLGGADGAE
jgi:hypothetical protein